MGTSEKQVIDVMHDTMKRLYQAAVELRGWRGQSEVARYLNASPQMLNNWESRGMSKRGMLDAEKVTGCSAVWLETGEGEMRSHGAALLPASDDYGELLGTWAFLLPAERDAIMEHIRPMAAHNKAVLEHHAKMVAKA